MSEPSRDDCTRTELKAVLFDIGDTLVRLDAQDGMLVTRAALSLGVQLAPGAGASVWDKVVAAASTEAELAKGRDISMVRHRAVWTALYRNCGADDLLDGLAERIYDLSIDPMSWVAFSDAAGVLRRLHDSGLPIGVVSDTGFDLRPVLANTQLITFIDVVVQSYEYGACKPEASIFLAACTELTSAPAQTLMVGDNYRCDGGAVEAGLPTLLLPKVGTDTRGLDLVLSCFSSAS